MNHFSEPQAADRHHRRDGVAGVSGTVAVASHRSLDRSSVFRRPSSVLGLLLSFLGLLIITGCALPFRREPPRPGRTTFASPLAILPAQSLGNFLLIEARPDRSSYFLVDTGSSVTLISPALVRPSVNAPRMRVAGAAGSVIELPSASLRRLTLGDVVFENIPVLVYDCGPLSAHLGVRIDGVLGFPLFREAVLTLDYPGSRVLLQPSVNDPLVPGAPVGFDDPRRIPLISVHLGDSMFAALIDSGSDAAFSLNPVGLEPRFVHGPRMGTIIGTIAGDRIQKIGRLAETLVIGNQRFEQPIVDLTDELSSIGGGALRHFAVSFDQERNRVSFHRDSREPIPAMPRRSIGVSFNKTPAYWRVVGVVPESSAEAQGVDGGDLLTRINGEPVSRWDLRRYEMLVASAPDIRLTFLNGTTETEKRVQVFELVP
ncbi:MAG: aspartyl protease family protein [Opitutus sp.]